MQQAVKRCPGLFCGRTYFENNTWSDCGACERGFRANESSVCTPCRDELSNYSWLYLGFMVLLPLLLHCFFIDVDAKDRKFSRNQLILTLCAFAEVALAAFFSILFMDPIWELSLHSCKVRKFSDFYTLFYNPNPNYDQHLHCTQEAAWPLQTIVLVFYFLCLVNMFLLRPFVNSFFQIQSKAPIYSALYFLPLLTFIHAVACGLIYYTFPYLCVAISMVTNAIHFSMKLDQTLKSLVKSSVMEVKNVVVIAVHWLLLAYGLASVDHHIALLCLAPFPSIFYIITVHFTDPAEFRDFETRVI